MRVKRVESIPKAKWAMRPGLQDTSPTYEVEIQPIRRLPVPLVRWGLKGAQRLRSVSARPRACLHVVLHEPWPSKSRET